MRGRQQAGLEPSGQLRCLGQLAGRAGGAACLAGWDPQPVGEHPSGLTLCPIGIPDSRAGATGGAGAADLHDAHQPGLGRLQTTYGGRDRAQQLLHLPHRQRIDREGLHLVDHPRQRRHVEGAGLSRIPFRRRVVAARRLGGFDGAAGPTTDPATGGTRGSVHGRGTPRGTTTEQGRRRAPILARRPPMHHAQRSTRVVRCTLFEHLFACNRSADGPCGRTPVNDARCPERPCLTLPTGPRGSARPRGGAPAPPPGRRRPAAANGPLAPGPPPRSRTAARRR